MILPSGLQYTLKRVGPKTDPCGTPYLTRLQQERELFTFTEVVRSTRYDRNHSKASSITHWRIEGGGQGGLGPPPPKIG